MKGWIDNRHSDSSISLFPVSFEQEGWCVQFFQQGCFRMITVIESGSRHICGFADVVKQHLMFSVMSLLQQPPLFPSRGMDYSAEVIAFMFVKELVLQVHIRPAFLCDYWLPIECQDKAGDSALSRLCSQSLSISRWKPCPKSWLR